jgi:hypothetical protein
MVIAAITLVSSARAGEIASEPELRLELDLVDGSRIIGVPSIESIPVETSYAKLDITLKQLLTLRIGEDRETATLELRNGDKLKGVADLGALKLETVFGKVKIGSELIKAMRVVLSGGPLPEALRKGLVLYYPFDGDEGSKVVDASDGRHDGDMVGAVKWNPCGAVGGCLEFEGIGESLSRYAELAPSDTYRTRGRLSAALWTKLDGKWAIFLSNYHGGSAYPGQFLFGYDSEQHLSVQMGQAPGVIVYAYSSDRGLMTIGAWHHVAFTYDESRPSGAKIRIYLDGVEILGYQVRQDGNGGEILGTTERLRLWAHRAAQPTEPGCIDEVMLFDRVLTDLEIAALAARAEPAALSAQPQRSR